MALQARLLERLLRQDGIEVVFLPSNLRLPAGLGWVERIPVLRTCARAVMMPFRTWQRSRRVDTIHIFAASWLYFFVVVAPVVLVGRWCGKSVIVNYRGGEARAFFRRFGVAVRPVLRSAHAITTPSEFLAEVIRECFGLPVSIVPNILNTSACRYRRRSTLTPTLLVNRHLESIYDVESVLRAFRVVQDRSPEASLCIAGTGSLEKSLRHLAAGLKLRNVEFLGAVPHTEMAALYDRCDILVNASRVDNFPGALLEASAAGLAIASTAAGGIPAMYRHGETAFLVEPGDWRALAAAIERLLESPALAAEMAERALALPRACEWSEVRRLLFGCYGLSPDAGRGENARGAAADGSRLPV
jgi:glycosyltransferase involved in cell wall biosynthesis